MELLLSVIETPEAVITGSVLADYYSAASSALMDAGLLKAGDHELVAVSGTAHDDAPVTVSRSPDGSQLGYFSPTAGWVAVPEEQMRRFRVDYPAVISRLMLQAELSSRHGPVALVPDLLWEIGDVRLGRRAQLVSIWFGRRLHDPSVWRQVGNAAKSRPASRLRILLTSTPAHRVPEDSLPGNLVVGVRDVIDFNAGLCIHPDILAARLDGSRLPNVDAAVDLSPDARTLTINGTIVIYFKSDIHIAIIRKLVAGHKDGKRFTVRDLLAAGRSGSTGLRRAFGAKKWAELSPYLKSRNGLWGFEV
ncbi:MAG: hypothetical protein U1E67_06725 [Hyphomicrobiales bacterium]